MTRFRGGPADKSVFLLRRLPVFIRVVIDDDGRIDVIDSGSAEPKPREVSYAYKLIIPHGIIRNNTVNARRNPGMPFNEYKFLAHQPLQAEMRNANSWREWCEDEPNRNLVGISLHHKAKRDVV